MNILLVKLSEHKQLKKPKPIFINVVHKYLYYH